MSQEALKQIEQYFDMLKRSGVDYVSGFSTAQAVASPKSLDAPLTTPETSQDPKQALLSLRETVVKCVKCQELAGSRKKVVFGSGNARAELVFVGEAPGFDEDVQGLPFVGKAGQLLTKIIESIGLTRQEVFICNVLKCRPPGNRNPLPDEISNCSPYLTKQIEIIQPKVICALGSFAARTLLQSDRSISALRGKFHDYQGRKLICTFHPAYLLRNPTDKRKVWEDMKIIRAELMA
jgi:uracil-DNA glycosylase